MLSSNPGVERIRRYFDLPGTDLQAWRERALRAVLVVTLISASFAYITNFIDSLQLGDYLWIGITTVAYLWLAVIALAPGIPYKFRTHSSLFLLYLLGVSALLTEGLQSNGRGYFIAIPIIAGLFIGTRTGVLSLLFNMILIVATALLVAFDFINPTDGALAETWISAAITLIMQIVIAAVPALALVARLQTNLEEAQSLSGQLQEEQQLLERRVIERTRALEASLEVSRRLSTILDRERLVGEVVDQLQRAFDYYHVHIYLVDEDRRELVLAGGTGKPAKLMLESGHRLAWGEGLVGRAAETNLPVLVRDVSREPDWLPNPLLPETKSEAAIPVARGDDVLGVLDVQEDVVDGLSRAEVDLLQSIANQTAVALQNAQLFERTQREAEQEAVATSIAQQIQRATTVEQALQVAVRELGRALPVPQTRVRLGANREGTNGNGRGETGG